jgi:DNA polymerase-3 subunit alpha
MDYVALNVKTEYTLLTSLIKINDLVSFASNHNINTLVICDDNLSYVMEFYHACHDHNIKPIVGLEVHLDDYNLNLYAENQDGYLNLVKLATINSTRKLNSKDLETYVDDLVCVVPYQSNKHYNELNKLYKHIYQGYSTLEERNLLDGDNLVYFNPVYYLENNDAGYYPYLLAIKDGKEVNEVVMDNLNHSYLNHMMDDIKNNQEIINLCSFELVTYKDTLPIYPCPDNLDSYKYLRRLCKEGLKRIFGTKVNKKYIERLEYELDVINKMGYSNYFLVVQDYVNYAKNNDILVGPGRGSAAGSLVAYLLNITSVDPIKYDLLFERFLNPERISMPDIDVDFQDNRREEIVDYCVNKYGNTKVAGIITFGTLASKQAVRDIGRSLGVDLKTIDHMCSMMDAKASLKDNLNNKELKEYVENDPDLTKLYKIAFKLEGLKRHKSIHPAGIVMSHYDLDNLVPLTLNHDNFYVIAYTYNYLEELGLLKMDFLALRNLTLISDTINNLKKDGVSINFDTIPNDDPKAIKIFYDVNTLGVFQFESSGMMNFLRKLHPTSFEDIASAIALFRPGPMQNIDTFIKRKAGKEKIDYYDNSLEPVLKSTYGLMIYQEQVMQVAHIMAGYSLGEADVLRKAISKKKMDMLASEETKFTERALARGYSKDIIDRVYKDILKFAGYGFNRAHSVVYSVIAYRMAYLKAYYPNYFMSSLLTMVIGSEIKTKEYIYECKLNTINILKPDINLSSDKYIVEDGGIRYPLYNIKGVGIASIEAIIKERQKGRYKDIYDFMGRIMVIMLIKKLWKL